MPTIEELLADPCTPYWAKDLIRSLMDKDAVDVANVLSVLAQVFVTRAKRLSWVVAN